VYSRGGSRFYAGFASGRSLGLSRSELVLDLLLGWVQQRCRARRSADSARCRPSLGSVQAAAYAGCTPPFFCCSI
jgi:hypothetical protein